MVVLIAFVVLLAVIGLGGIIKGLFWLAAIGFILALVVLALGLSRLRKS